MTVYIKDKPEWFRQAAESMLRQTIIPDEFLLIEDGPITSLLTKEIDDLIKNNKTNTRIIIDSLSSNMGAGPARQRGVELASNEHLAFLDADDISINNRIEKQMNVMNEKEVDFVGSNVYEFKDFIDNIVSTVIMPEKNEDIVRFAKKRCPARQSGSFVKKTSIINAGGYVDSPLTEDWHLYIRMMKNNSRFFNIQECLTYVRVGDDFYSRRGGIKYLRKIISFKKWLLNVGYINNIEYLKTSFPSIIVCLMPNSLRDFVYRKLLRN